jgi:hypothetical protein
MMACAHPGQSTPTLHTPHRDTTRWTCSHCATHTRHPKTTPPHSPALAKLKEDPNRGFVYARRNTYAASVGAPRQPLLTWAGTPEGDGALCEIEQRRAEQFGEQGWAAGGAFWDADYVVAEPGGADAHTRTHMHTCVGSLVVAWRGHVTAGCGALRLMAALISHQQQPWAPQAV